MKMLICAVAVLVMLFAVPLAGAADTTTARPTQELEQLDAKSKRACGKKCIDAQDACNKTCKKGHTVDRKCKFNCTQARNTCLKACR